MSNDLEKLTLQDSLDPKSKLLEVAKERGALLFGEFELSAGGTSSYYFDGRLLTLDPEGSYLTARCFLPTLLSCGAEAIAGPTLGADPIVAAIAAISHVEGSPIPALIVRKETKSYGGRRSVEGPVREGMKVAVVDDTCTSGASLFHAIKEIEKEGCEVVQVLSILDRGAGGSEECRRRGYEFLSILAADDDGNISVVSD